MQKNSEISKKIRRIQKGRRGAEKVEKVGNFL